jgi:hypothetical protein
MAAPAYNPSLKSFVVVDRVDLPTVHSASGLAEVPEGWLVCCDDFIDLYLLDAAGALQGQWPISPPPAVVVDGRVPKKHKRDFEAIANWRVGKQTHMLVFGSGSKLPQRSHIVQVHWDGALKSAVEVQAEAFFNHMMQVGKIGPEQLNIEGATAFDKQLILLNRGLNQVIVLDLKAVQTYLAGGCKGAAPDPKIHGHKLPDINGVQVGFSGACTDLRRNRIYFCASAEDTADWIADGAVLGSYVGWIVRPTAADGGELFAMPVVDDAGMQTLDKIEAIGLLPPVNGNVQLIAFTDTDGGPSQMLTLELR